MESSVREYHAGECILINSDIIHSTKCTSPNKAILFQIPLSFLSLYLPDADQLVFNLEKPGRKCCPPDKTRYPSKRRWFRCRLQMISVRRALSLRFNSLLFEILFQLYHNFSIRVVHGNQTQRDKDRARLDTILNYIRQNYKQHISIEEIANVAYLQSWLFLPFL